MKTTAGLWGWRNFAAQSKKPKPNANLKSFASLIREILLGRYASPHLEQLRKNQRHIQYDGSKDDLDWRIDFKYLNFI